MNGGFVGIGEALRMVAGLPPLEPWAGGEADLFCRPMPDAEKQRVGDAVERAKEALQSAIQEGRVAVAGREVAHLGAHVSTAGREVGIATARLRTARLVMDCLLGVEGSEGGYCALRLLRREVEALADEVAERPEQGADSGACAWMLAYARDAKARTGSPPKWGEAVEACKAAGYPDAVARAAYKALPPDEGVRNPSNRPKGSRTRARVTRA